MVIGEQEHRIDMKCIEPYRRVISHGGTHTLTPVSSVCFMASDHFISCSHVLFFPCVIEMYLLEDFMLFTLLVNGNMVGILLFNL